MGSGNMLEAESAVSRNQWRTLHFYLDDSTFIDVILSGMPLRNRGN